MAGLINWKKATIPVSNPDPANVYTGVDISDGILYQKDSSGTVTKYPTFAQIIQAVLTGFSVVAASSIVATDTILQAFQKTMALINDLQAQIDVWNELITTADLTSASNVTLTNVPELQFSAVAGNSYYLEYTIRFRSGTATTGFAVTLATSGTAVGTIAAQVNMPIAADGAAALYTGSIATLGDLVIGTAVETINTDYICNIKGVFECTTSGVILPQFRSEINATTVTFRKGSISLIRKF
jgi:hypothetical protein